MDTQQRQDQATVVKVLGFSVGIAFFATLNILIIIAYVS